MEEAKRGESSTGAGMIVSQWYVDAFYAQVEKLPTPTNPAFALAVEKLEADTERIVEECLREARVRLAARGVRLVVVER